MRLRPFLLHFWLLAACGFALTVRANLSTASPSKKIASLRVQSIPHEWIMHLRPGREAALVERELGRYFFWKRRFGPNQEFALVEAKAASWPVRFIEKYADLFQPNYLYRAYTDPELVKSWGLTNTGQVVGDLGAGLAGKDVGLVKASALIDTLPEIAVAVVDSGTDLAHEDLKGSLWRNPKEIAGNGIDDDGNGYVDDVHGWNFSQKSNDVSDDNGHGSLVAGIIAATADNNRGSRGVARKARIVTLKALDAQGVGTTQSAVDAIAYAVKAGIKIVNLSWGGTHYDPALYEVMKWAGNQGVLFTVAAGNDGKDNDHDELPAYPASFRLPCIVSVAAYDNSDQLASFSNFGKETVQLGAPGVQIYGPGKGIYRYGDGTSFASPFVAAVAALVKAQTPSLSVAALRETLLASSEVIHYYQKEKTASAGRVHAYNALSGIRPPRPTPPAQWTKMTESKATAHPYGNKAFEVFRFQYPGATHIRAHFTQLETEGCCDRVLLRDGLGREFASYGGSLGELTSADALGDTLEVILQSDFSIGKFGFEVDYVEVSYQWDEWFRVSLRLEQLFQTSMSPLLDMFALSRR